MRARDRRFLSKNYYMRCYLLHAFKFQIVKLFFLIQRPRFFGESDDDSRNTKIKTFYNL